MFKYLGIIDGRATAQISEDNLQISWHANEDGSIPDPPWDDLYMEQYGEDFNQARISYDVMRNTFTALQSLGMVALNKNPDRSARGKRMKK